MYRIVIVAITLNAFVCSALSPYDAIGLNALCSSCLHTPPWCDGPAIIPGDPCGFVGVACDLDGFVVALRLNNTGLRCAALPEMLYLMGYLQALDLSSNHLSGTLPVKWGLLMALTFLDLSRNTLTGELPDSWNAMSSLSRIILNNNQLTGTLPMLWAFLTSLNVFSIEFNAITGTLPKEYQAWSLVRGVYMHNNQIEGTLPDAWQYLSNVSEMYLGYNLIAGTLPREWASMTALTTLYLPENVISGTLPKEWCTMTALQQLLLYGNALSGTLPPEWGTFRQTRSLQMGGNLFTGTLPAQWSTMESLQILDLVANNITGELPAQWADAQNLTQVYLDMNALTGFVPPAWAHSSITTLSISHNSMVFPWPPCDVSFDTLHELYINHNPLGSRSTVNFSRWVPRLTHLSLKSCGLEVISDMPASLRVADFSTNPISIITLSALARFDFIDVTPTTVTAPTFDEHVNCTGIASSRISPFIISPLKYTPSDIAPCDSFYVEHINTFMTVGSDNMIHALLRFSSFVVSNVTGVDWSSRCASDLVVPRFVVQVLPTLEPFVAGVSWSGVSAGPISPKVSGIQVISFPVSNLLFDVSYTLRLNISVRDTLSSTEGINDHMDSVVSQKFVAPPCPNAVMAVAGSTNCVACPPFGTCDGSSVVKAKKGFWRKNASWLPFYKCDDGSNACDRTDTDGTDCSSDAYDAESFLCSECADGYTFSIGRVCIPCPAPDTQLIVVVVATGLTIIYLTLSIVMAMRVGKENSAAGCMHRLRHAAEKVQPLIIGGKMLLNYFVIVGLVSEAVLPIFLDSSPEVVLQSLTAAQTLIARLNVLGAASCMFPLTVPERLEWSLVILGGFLFVETGVSVLLALMLPSTFPGALHTAYGAASMTLQALYEFVLDAAGEAIGPCSTFMFYSASDNTEIMWTQSLVKDHSMECTGTVYTEMLVMGWLTVIVVGCGVPCAVLACYRNIRRQHDDIYAASVFNFLTENFTYGLWYWELVIMLRKMMGVVVITCVPREVQLQALLLYYLFWGAMHHWCRPFSYKKFNQMEYVSLSVGFLSVNSVMLVAASRPSVDDGYPEGIMSQGTTSVVMICLIAVIGANVLGTIALLICIASYVRTKWSHASTSVNCLEEKWALLAIPSDEEYASGNKVVEQRLNAKLEAAAFRLGQLLGWLVYEDGNIQKEEETLRQKVEEDEAQLRSVTGVWDVQVRSLAMRWKMEEEEAQLWSVIVAWRCLVGDEGGCRMMMRSEEFLARSLLQAQTEERVYRVLLQDIELNVRHHGLL